MSSIIWIAFGLISMLLVFYRKTKHLKSMAQDNQHTVYTEIRLRASGRKTNNPLSIYSETELESIKEQLRGIVFKKRLRHALNDDDKLILKRFPNSYKLAKHRDGKKERFSFFNLFSGK